MTYLTPADVDLLWRPLTEQEQARAEALIPLIEGCLRQEAANVGKDLDAMVEDGTLLPETVTAVVVDVLSRILRQDTSGEAMSQESQSALGYSWSGTYAVPGGGISNAIMRNDLKRLGLRRQRIGVIDLYAQDSRRQCDAD